MVAVGLHLWFLWLCLFCKNQENPSVSFGCTSLQSRIFSTKEQRSMTPSSAFKIKTLAVSAALACAGLVGTAQAETTVRLGFAAPLTGPQAHYGEDMRNGLTLALEEANAKGIKLDGDTAKFVLVSNDDQADPRAAVQVAQQIANAKVNGILGHFNSGTTIPASRVYNDAGIPQIAMATSPEYTLQGYDTTFRMMTSDTQQCAAAGVFIVKD